MGKRRLHANDPGSRGRTWSALRSDDGVAMILVVALVVILFVAATALIILVNLATSSQKNQEIRVKEIHLADAGINAYLYELRRDPNYYATHPTLGPTAEDDGVWFVSATPPAAGQPLTLSAQGRLSSQPASKTVIATVRFPTFADYMFLANTDINVGAGATILGRVRTNGNLNNSGVITLASYAAGTISGPGSAVFGSALPTGVQAKYPGQPRIDFAQVRADMDNMRAAAQANLPSTYFAASGYSNGGYLIRFSNGTFTRTTVSGVSGRAVTTVGGTTTLPTPIPPNGVIYVQDNVWVEGTYSAPCTVASAKNIYVVSNVLPLVENSTYTMGLVAAQNIIVPTEYDSISSDTTTTIVAAMLAQSGSIYGNLVSGTTKPGIHIRGSMAYNTYGYFASGDPATAGFRKRLYQYDARLEDYPPPMYPQSKTGTLRVNSWVEGG